MAVLLATLLGPGVLGDETDSTFEEGSRVDGNFFVPSTTQHFSDLSPAGIGAIEFVRFLARVGWYTSGVGPSDPQVWLQLTCGGVVVSSDPFFPPGGVGVYSDIPDPMIDYALDFDTGLPWTVDRVNQLRMRTAWRADSNGSGETTFARVTALRAHVWGELAPPPPGPPGPLAPDNIRAGALRSGNIRRSLAGGTIVAPLSTQNPTAALRSGNIRGRGGPA